jgi:hypothetical protein
MASTNYTSTDETIAHGKIEAMERGFAVVVCNATLHAIEAIGSEEILNNLRTAKNIGQVGRRDSTVAWVKGTPPAFRQETTDGGFLIAYARAGLCRD